MQPRDTIRMANQIAEFFKGYGHDQALPEIADHINRFWEPRMRGALFSLIESGGDGLDPLVKDAVHLYRRPREFSGHMPDTKPGPKDSNAADFIKAAAGYESSDDH